MPGGLSNVVAIAAGGEQSAAITARQVPLAIALNGQSPVLQFRTFSGRDYSVEYSPDLRPGSWSPLPGAVIPGNGYDALVTDTNAAATTPTRFYRIR